MLELKAKGTHCSEKDVVGGTAQCLSSLQLKQRMSVFSSSDAGLLRGSFEPSHAVLLVHCRRPICSAYLCTSAPQGLWHTHQ